MNGENLADKVDFHGLVDANAPLETVEDVEDDDIALMIYTSGTTGRPKGVMLSHHNLHSNAVATWEAAKTDAPDVTILCLPLAHSFGVVVMNAGKVSPRLCNVKNHAV